MSVCTAPRFAHILRSTGSCGVVVSNAYSPFLCPSGTRAPLHCTALAQAHERLERPVATNEKPYAAHLLHRVEDSPVLRGPSGAVVPSVLEFLRRSGAKPRQLRFSRMLTRGARTAGFAVRNKSLRGA